MSSDQEANITAYVAIAISLMTTIVGIVNHKRLRSVCCNKKLEVSIDIEATTPPDKTQSDAVMKIKAPINEA